MWVQLLEGTPLKIWEGQNNVQISAQFLTTFDFDREYLQTDRHIEHLKKKLARLQPLSRWRKNLVSFGPQTTKF